MTHEMARIASRTLGHGTAQYTGKKMSAKATNQTETKITESASQRRRNADPGRNASSSSRRRLYESATPHVKTPTPGRWGRA
jgi:hypothetical protein